MVCAFLVFLHNQDHKPIVCFNYSFYITNFMNGKSLPMKTQASLYLAEFRKKLITLTNP